MAFVADNSVVLAWFVKSQANAYSEKMLRRAAEEVVHVPIVWHLEFANALYQLERRRKLAPAATSAIVNSMNALDVAMDPSPPEQTRLLDLARQYELSVYDASYLELAIRLSLKLAARDGALAVAAQKAGLLAE
jgi:predicted nucleic acid-binding protein